MTPPSIAICVPARDEADRLPQLFDAIDRLDVPAGTAVAVCLLLDGCRDASAAIVDAWRSRSRHPVHPGQTPWAPANAGRARDAAMRLGIAACADDADILLSTDADSTPRSDWLTAMTAALAQADLVVGDVLRRGAGHPDQDRVERYYARLHALRRRIDPVAWEAPQTHPHRSGANFGLQVRTYRALGGFAALEQGEDARLVDDAARAGLRVRCDAASVVHTSDRRSGRVRGGLATTLRDLDAHGLAGIAVADPADQLWQYRVQSLARGTFADKGWPALKAAMGLTTDHLLGVARDCPNGEAFAMRVVPVPPGGMRQLPFLDAEAALDELTAAVCPAEAA